MEFRTKITLANAPRSINHSDALLLMGSCFSENIGAKLAHYKFNVNVNPFGVLYNPVSLANSIDLIVNNTEFTTANLFEKDGLWHSFSHHSKFSGSKKQKVLHDINLNINQAHQHLKTTKYLLITLGTAWVYQFIDTNKIVSNCHKLPAKQFLRKRLSVDDIVYHLNNIITKATTINSEMKVVFTVSPIRHLKDGFLENQVSKSSLLLAVNEMVEHFDAAHYFPAYEIMMDDLRDYRFYADDMTHPAPLAIDYIWDCFVEHWINSKSKEQFVFIDKIMKAIAHRPFQVDSAAHQKFLKKQVQSIEVLKTKFPSMNFDFECSFLNEQILK